MTLKSHSSDETQVAAIQTFFETDVSKNIERLKALIRSAASQGAQIIALPELIEGPYFCKEEDEKYFSMAKPIGGHPTVEALQSLARDLRVVLPASVFEKEGPHYYNTVVVIDADGSILGSYRKSHIPDGPGYQEKFYFRPGNTGFKVWTTRYGVLGVGICWDQWFPEAARAMALLGADLLLYPTAIGSEPQNPSLDTKDLWQRAMCGHAVSNLIPIAAANRIGNENGQIFYGHSFVTNHFGEILSECSRTEEGICQTRLNFSKIRTDRAAFGFFRDRRPELYKILTDPAA